MEVSANQDFVGLAFTDGNGHLFKESNLLGLIIRGVNINKAKFVVADGGVYNQKSAVFISHDICHLFT